MKQYSLCGEQPGIEDPKEKKTIKTTTTTSGAQLAKTGTSSSTLFFISLLLTVRLSDYCDTTSSDS
ncbi:MAG: hypothetical protein Q4P66_01370 [Actinomycetaceae bacterium]|nr:hypothetical protein [Actinomycetaceae bacterium]